MMKLLIPDNKFALQGIRGRQVLIDWEMKNGRIFRSESDMKIEKLISEFINYY